MLCCHIPLDRFKRKNDYSKNTGPNRLIDLNSKVGPNNHKTHGIRLALNNAQSVRNKTDMIVDHIIENDIDVLCITESWLCESGDEKVIKDLTPDVYKFINVPRSKGCKEKHGGGIGILYRASYKLNTKTSMLLLSKIVKVRSIHHLVHYVSQLFTGDHHLKNTKSFLVNSLINSVNFPKIC